MDESKEGEDIDEEEEMEGFRILVPPCEARDAIGGVTIHTVEECAEEDVGEQEEDVDDDNEDGVEGDGVDSDSGVIEEEASPMKLGDEFLVMITDARGSSFSLLKTLLI